MLPPKCLCPPTRLHGTITQNAMISTFSCITLFQYYTFPTLQIMGGGTLWLTNLYVEQGAVGWRGVTVTEKGGHKFTLVPPWYTGGTPPATGYCFPTSKHCVTPPPPLPGLNLPPSTWGCLLALCSSPSRECDPLRLTPWHCSCKKENRILHCQIYIKQC